MALPRDYCYAMPASFRHYFICFVARRDGALMALPPYATLLLILITPLAASLMPLDIDYAAAATITPLIAAFILPMLAAITPHFAADASLPHLFSIACHVVARYYYFAAMSYGATFR